jgi:hypothetical protein
MTEKIYPDSGVELNEFVAKNYDKIMNTLSFGLYFRTRLESHFKRSRF